MPSEKRTVTGTLPPLKCAARLSDFGGRRGGERPGHHQSLGVHEPEAGVDAAVELDDDIGDLQR